MPGIAASTSETWLLGAPPNSAEAPENSFDFEVTWACTSMPMTTSQSPVEPLRSLAGLLCSLMSPTIYRAGAAKTRLRQNDVKTAPLGGSHETPIRRRGGELAFHASPRVVQS